MVELYSESVFGTLFGPGMFWGLNYNITSITSVALAGLIKISFYFT